MVVRFSLLIVDDEPGILSGLKDLYPWNDWGFRVVGAYLSADEALAFLNKHPADIVLTDIRMPGMDGFRFADILAEKFPDTRVIFLSAYSDFEFARKAMRVGVMDYLVKPVQYEHMYSSFAKAHAALETSKKRSSDTQAGDSDAYHQQIVRYILGYIEQNPATASLEEAARALGFSTGYISRVFHSLSGQTFSECLAKQRMTCAAHLLAGAYSSMKDVAYWVGYDSVRSFHNAFTRFYGVTPARYAAGERRK